VLAWLILLGYLNPTLSISTNPVVSNKSPPNKKQRNPINSAENNVSIKSDKLSTNSEVNHKKAHIIVINPKPVPAASKIKKNAFISFPPQLTY